ncbi:hypothetical protein BDV25DRAFT_160432 [Aspergillus avenaceus]|uniref:Tetraspanin Tsp3 n=1 Tax=Aspergillus avenaceus TaxID=36643 RepID=A0A5N6TM42_ASPAV|nr:hypothetical protein BDV25DRAFT_160432 [Aspergillus avenaceus]
MQWLLILLSLLTTLSLILSAIAWSRTTTFAPLTALATFLPILGPALLYIPHHLNPTALKTRILASALRYLLTILPTSLATLAFTYLFSSGLFTCHLNERWQAYFHAKDSRSIRAIQDSLHCCGFRSVRDRAWPFKDATHGDDTCQRQIGYERACLQPLMGRERGVAGMVAVGALLVFVVVVCSSFLFYLKLLGPG